MTQVVDNGVATSATFANENVDVPRVIGTPDEPVVPASLHPVNPGAPSLRGRRKEKWIAVSQEEYPGFTIKMWVNHPRHLAADARSGIPEIQKAALNQIILQHNGWLDENDELIPQPGTPVSEAEFDEQGVLTKPAGKDFWDVIPDELAALVFSLISLEATELSFSTVTERRNMRRISGQR